MSEPGGNPPNLDVDRRRSQRIQLDDRPEAILGGVPVSIIELGLSGLRISSSEPFREDNRAELTFDYEGEEVRAMCRIVRSELQSRLSEVMGELVYHVGLEIIEIKAQSKRSIRKLIGERVSRALELQKANALGETANWDSVIESTRHRPSGRSEMYTSCRLGAGGQWQEATILKPTQPRDGFTIRATATDEEIGKLKKAYEEGSPEIRDMIRVFAEISITEEDSTLPPQRFEP